MKISVSLPEVDVAFLDEYVERTRVESRSAVLHKAIELLRRVELEDEYAEAWEEWETGEDAVLWDQATEDGLADAAR